MRDRLVALRLRHSATTILIGHLPLKRVQLIPTTRKLITSGIFTLPTLFSTSSTALHCMHALY